MTIASWPASLPQYVETDGYRESPPPRGLRTQMDAGVAKTRPRFTAVPRPLGVTLVLTDDQMETLDAFYVGSAASGAVRWAWVHPRTRAACEMRFTAEPQYVAAGPGVWKAVLSLEIMP